MSWDISYRDAMAEAARTDIPPDDAETMWQKYNELGCAVRAGDLADADATSTFGEFCKGLARIRNLRTLMSPNLDVIGRSKGRRSK